MSTAALSQKLDSILRAGGMQPSEAKVYGLTFLTYWKTEAEAVAAAAVFKSAGLEDTQADKEFGRGGRFVASGNVPAAK